MSSQATTPSANAPRDGPDFSLVLGGPLFQILRRAHLIDETLALARQRIIAITLLAWLPLLVLSAVDGHLLGAAGGTVPFLLDIEAHSRFLIALPLLIAAEVMVHRSLQPVGRAFLERNLIPAQELPRFNAAVQSAFRLRNSILAEALLIVAVYAIGVMLVWRRATALDTATWYVTSPAEGSTLRLAGLWYGYVSLPIFQFLLLRWYFRVFIWTRFLWQVSRIRLKLIPTHPDRLGGLGFLTHTVYAFALLLVAHGVLLTGQIAGRIFFLGATLPEFKFEIAAILGFLLCIVFGPLLVFTPQLTQARRNGLLEYGTLAERYVREFDGKWLHTGAPSNEPLMGSSDIQSLADLANSFEVIRTMRMTPITRNALLQIAAAVLLPIATLLPTMMPLNELVKTLFNVFF